MSAAIEQQFAAIMRGAEFGDEATRRTMERELRERLAEGRPAARLLRLRPDGGRSATSATR